MAKAEAISQSGLQQLWQKRYQAWIARRAPSEDEITLRQRRIFIFPSKAGGGLFLLLALLLLAAINYQNNMVFILSFWLLAVFVVVILQTFANVLSLTVKLQALKPVFAGELSELILICSASKRPAHRALQFSFKPRDLIKAEQYPQQAQTLYCDVLGSEVSKVSLPLLAAERGWQTLPAVLLQSVYPLGWLNCWSWLRFSSRLLVYPRPIAPPAMANSLSQAAEQSSQIAGDDDFLQLRPYQTGDEIKHLDWFTLAKGQGLHSRQFTAWQRQDLVLDWGAFPGVETERRLSYLSYLARVYNQQQMTYSLVLPGMQMENGSGQAHYQQVLKALAEFRLPDESTDNADASGVKRTHSKTARRKRRL